MRLPAEVDKKSIQITLYLFYSFYFALILLARKILRPGILNFTLPFKIDITETFFGFALGTIFIVIFSILFQNKEWIFRIILVAGFLLGSISINYFLYSFYFPPYSTTAPGDLAELGNQRWKNDYSFEMFSSLFNKYYLHTVVVNPGINNYKELSRASGFGVYWKTSNEIPQSLSHDSFTEIENTLSNDYVGFSEDDIEYRLYEAGNTDRIALTTYDSMILFIPEQLISE